MKLSKLVLVGVCFLAVGLIATAGEDTAKKLVGTWKVTKSESGGPPGATIEFTKDGKVKLRAEVKGKVFEASGTYKLKGESLTTTIEFGGKSMTETGKIKKITEKQLVIEDEKGKIDELERVK
ncbi:MAG: lipocalin family protein [Gemmataceae bacterium]|nr:lipocalin family protein [Gemmataceae bacterium]